MKKGIFIVIDGIDASGKDTQTRLLTQRLVSVGHHAESISFPRYKDNFSGKFLWNALKENKHGDFIHADPYLASYPYAEDRSQSAGWIRDTIKFRGHVISDRYVSSNQIHQGGKIADPKAREEFLLWLDELEYVRFNNPRPDLVVYLHAPVELSLRLIKERSIAQGAEPDQAESDAEHLVASQKSALSIFGTRDNWIKIDCELGKTGEMRTRPDINDEIYQKLQPFLPVPGA